MTNEFPVLNEELSQSLADRNISPRKVGMRLPGKIKVCYALPTYNNMIYTPVGRSFFQESQFSQKYEVTTPDAMGSLLGLTFNALWGAALQANKEGEADAFVMHHGDIHPEFGGLEILLDEMYAHDADIMSAVVPIKDGQGITSTAIGNPNDPEGDWIATPISLNQICQLPETFSIKDTCWPDMELLINTGFMAVNLNKPWVHEVDANGDLKHFFTIRDRIHVNADGSFTRFVIPEDWGFSRMVHRSGGKVMATRKVQIIHYGSQGFSTPTTAQYDKWAKDEEDQQKAQDAVRPSMELVNDLQRIRAADPADFEFVKNYIRGIREQQTARGLDSTGAITISG